MVATCSVHHQGRLNAHLPEIGPVDLLCPGRGVLVAQQFRPQARVMASARGITWVEADYDRLGGGAVEDHPLF